ncbi:MAG: hypothetical protein P1V18_05250 [Candidatus Gracilibacteria bacterium]|nr:hypothetical protein [Candidatus Gracilibacteria bacterium]
MTQLIGILGAMVLVCGAAYPIKSFAHPIHSMKNWLFAIGGFLMLIYSVLNYLNGGPVFFIFLQGLINISSIFMLSNTPEKTSTPLIISGSLGLVAWSLSLFEGYNTLFFIIGLSAIALGYILAPGTCKRNLSLTLGSLLIALFSFFVNNYIFLWLNLFFAVFSGYYSWKLRKQLLH